MNEQREASFWGADTAVYHPRSYNPAQLNEDHEAENPYERPSRLIAALNAYVNSYRMPVHRRTALEVMIRELFEEFSISFHSDAALLEWTGARKEGKWGYKDFKKTLDDFLAIAGFQREEVKDMEGYLFTHLSYISLGTTTKDRHLRGELLICCQEPGNLPYTPTLENLAQFCKPGTSRQHVGAIKDEFTKVYPSFKSHMIFKNKQKNI